MNESPSKKKAYEIAGKIKAKYWEEIRVAMDEMGNDERQSFFFSLQATLYTEFCVYDMRRYLADKKLIKSTKEGDAIHPSPTAQNQEEEISTPD